jgi:succinyl-diaminopimelate desuccinylase
MTSGRNAVQPIDPVELTRELIRCPSVTPKDEGALGLLERVLGGLGCACTRLPFGEGADRVDNLYARLGSEGPNFCFAGHTDVVPVGETSGWTRPPFEAEIEDGMLYGRGAADMKGGIGAFVGAVSRFLAERKGDFPGSISLLITGDEEGPAVNGTAKVLDWLRSKGEALDACLVGEPTNPERLGQMIKIGRRGSVTARLTVHGVQGHVAYPDRAKNPIPMLIKVLDKLISHRLDEGTDAFQPSNLEVVTIDVGNTATNVIPAKATAVLNIRFNDVHTSQTLKSWIEWECEDLLGANVDYELAFQVSGEAFVTPPGPLSDLVSKAIKTTTGIEPELSTSGGTSDARFIKDMCPVVEFGLSGQTMHKVDECVAVADIEALSEIYKSVLDGYFPR